MKWIAFPCHDVISIKQIVKSITIWNCIRKQTFLHIETAQILKTHLQERQNMLNLCRKYCVYQRHCQARNQGFSRNHDDVIKWKHFLHYWPFVRGIHRSPVNSPHKGQWRGALMFSLISVWIDGWVTNDEAGDLRRHRAHYDVIVMEIDIVI